MMCGSDGSGVPSSLGGAVVGSQERFLRRTAAFPRLRMLVALVLGGVAGLAPSSGLAANGTVLDVSEVLAGTAQIVDIAQDTTDGSFWVLGANGTTTANHRLYHLDPSREELLGTIENPHPSGTIAQNDLTTNRGLAYRPLDNRLLVLASVGPRLDQDFVIRAVARDGTPVAGSEIIVDLDQLEGASLYGLAYDSITRDLWTVDVRGDRILRVNASGAIISAATIPGKDTPYTLLWGQGISFRVGAGGGGILYVPYGDIFNSGPEKILELTTESQSVGGEPFAVLTGNETPLDVPRQDLRGLQAWTDRFGKHHLTIVGQAGRIWDIERAVSDPRPPTSIECRLNVNNQVELSWINHGSDEGGAYGGRIQVLRNGTPLATIDGSAEGYIDETPIEGTSTYALRGSETSGGAFSDASLPCRVTVGPGGLVDWTPFPGTKIFDVTEDPESHEVFVTDQVEGAIYHFSSDLELIDAVAAPFPDPAGIAFVPAIPLGFPPAIFENVLAVGESSGKRLRILSAADPGGPIITTLTLRLDDVAAPVMGGLTFKADAREFFGIESTSGSIYRFASNGALLGRCAPVFVQDPLGVGVTYDPIQDSFLSAFEDGIVRELFAQANCSTSDFAIGLEALGPTFEDDGFVDGLQISANTLLVASSHANALFRVLLFPYSPDFVRGDVNLDDKVNITDAFDLAVYLFLDGVAPRCNDAADTNDDGILDVSDPVYLLFALFVPGSPPPPMPFPSPGNDPTFRDNLGCAE